MLGKIGKLVDVLENQPFKLFLLHYKKSESNWVG